MKTKPENPPAFPRPELVLSEGKRKFMTSFNQPGMTLRDYFAGQALVGLLSHPNLKDDIKFAATSYKIADAMLKAREAI
mgnify:CR=1 FL=1